MHTHVSSSFLLRHFLVRLLLPESSSCALCCKTSKKEKGKRNEIKQNTKKQKNKNKKKLAAREHQSRKK